MGAAEGFWQSVVQEAATDLCVGGTSGLSPSVAFQTVRQQKDQGLQPLTWHGKKQFNRTA